MFSNPEELRLDPTTIQHMLQLHGTLQGKVATQNTDGTIVYSDIDLATHKLPIPLTGLPTSQEYKIAVEEMLKCCGEYLYRSASELLLQRANNIQVISNTAASTSLSTTRPSHLPLAIDNKRLINDLLRKLGLGVILTGVTGAIVLLFNYKEAVKQGAERLRYWILSFFQPNNLVETIQSPLLQNLAATAATPFKAAGAAVLGSLGLAAAYSLENRQQEQINNAQINNAQRNTQPPVFSKTDKTLTYLKSAREEIERQIHVLPDQVNPSSARIRL